MIEIKKRRLQSELTLLINSWLEKTGESEPSLPWLGENVAVFMSEAAFAVLLGISDAQDYPSANDMLNEN